MDTSIGDVHYQTQIWPILKELYTPNKKLICFNGICTPKERKDGGGHTTTQLHTTIDMKINEGLQHTKSIMAHIINEPTEKENIQPTTQNATAVQASAMEKTTAPMELLTLQKTNGIKADMAEKSTNNPILILKNIVKNNSPRPTPSMQIKAAKSVVKANTGRYTTKYTVKTFAGIQTFTETHTSKISETTMPPAKSFMETATSSTPTNESNCEIIQNVIFPEVDPEIAEGYLVVVIYILAISVFFLLIILAIVCIKKKAISRELVIEMEEISQQKPKEEESHEIEEVERHPPEHAIENETEV